jgi:O-acetyl-ADP-ribose deacetylase (regulator of RNase III)
VPLQIVRNDITKMKVDAIVNAANSSLLGGGGVDGCIHRAAGPELLAECKMLGGCETGSAKITKGYRLPCKYVIHAVGPRWRDGKHGEREKLISCYRTSLALAKEHGCETVAFPLISSGIYGYPKDQALKVAIDTISDFLLENDMTVYIVIFDRKAYQIGEKLFSDIAAYIDDNYVDEHTDSRSERLRRMQMLSDEPEEETFGAPLAPMAASAKTLDDALSQIDESFSEMLLRKIDEKGMTDAQCYKKANIDRKLFSKIRSDKLYKPSKPTALAFAIALELPLDETKELLMKAGFALSHSNKFDIIIEFFIEHGNYNVFEINEALFAFDQSLLGA